MQIRLNAAHTYTNPTSLEELLSLARELLKQALKGEDTELLEQLFQDKAKKSGKVYFCAGGQA